MISPSLIHIEALNESLIWYWWWEQPWKCSWGLCLWLDRTLNHHQSLKINHSSPLKLEGGCLAICLEITKGGWMGNSWAEVQHSLLEGKHWPHGICKLPEQTRTLHRPLPSNEWNHKISVQLNTATSEAAGRARICLCCSYSKLSWFLPVVLLKF